MAAQVSKVTVESEALGAFRRLTNNAHNIYYVK